MCEVNQAHLSVLIQVSEAPNRALHFENNWIPPDCKSVIDQCH